MPLQWYPTYLPLSRGLNSKSDKRALEAPDLAVCRDAEFEETGGMQTRKPYAAIAAAATFTDGRRIVANGDELLLFTKDALYTWADRSGEWISKGTYLAPKIDERSVFVRSSEQSLCDRAELDNCVVFAWVDTTSADTVYVAAMDKVTGAVLLGSTSIATGTRPRLVALDSSIVLFYGTGANIKALSIDPDALATSVAVTPTTLVAATTAFDVAAVGSNLILAYKSGANYGVSLLSPALATLASDVPARTCDGPIAVAVSPDETRIQVVRSNSTNIQGDLLNATTLAAVYTNQAVGTVAATPVNQITAAYRSVATSSVYRCYAFWSAEENEDDTSFDCKTNWVSTGNTLGTQSTLVKRLGVASRAFDHEGQVYVWLAFAGESNAAGMVTPLGLRAQLQNTYFLYREDALLVAKATGGTAGGFSQATGHLPGVQDLGEGVFTWCGNQRRIIDLGGNGDGYEARAPREITVTFDSDEARRCARLGETLYITGGQILQYDGEGLAEVGFHIYPWYFDTVDAGAGGKDATTISYKSTLSWPNARGEVDRSTTATGGQVGPIASGRKVGISVVPAHVTLKQGTRSAPAVEIWATKSDPTDESPFYLVTSKDPSDSTNPNRYLANVPTSGFLSTFEDELADADLEKLATNPENGGVLENLCPPPASIITASQDRIFLAGVPGDPDRVWYSKLRGDGEVAAFHDALTVDVPQLGGAITALAMFDENLIVFRESAIYLLAGDGFDNASGGQNYGPARRLSADVGAVSAEAVAQTPAGLVFKSLKGWYLLQHNGAPEYIGAQAAGFDDDEVVSVTVLEAQHQIRCMTTERVLMFDYVEKQWAEWTIAGGLGAVMHEGRYTYATDTEVLVEQDDWTATDYGLDAETAWIPLGQMQGEGSVRWMMVLGEYRSDCRLRVRIAYNYAESDADGPTWVDDKYFNPTGAVAVVGGPLQVRHGPKRTKVQAIKFRLTVCSDALDGSPPTTGEGVKLTGISLELGYKRGLYRGLPAAQKQ